MRVFLIIVAVIVVVGLAAGAVFLLSPDARNLFRPTTTIDDPELMQEVIGYVGPPYRDDYDTTRVNGYVDNFSSEEIAVVTIEVQLLNEDGEREELVTFELEDIGAGNRKTYDISAGTLPGPRTAEITIVSMEVYE
jgi:hypothetical protein